MEKIYTKIDALFVNGAISGILTIIFNTFFFMFLNRFLNRMIEKQTWKQKAVIKKVKTIIIMTLYFVNIVSQITFMKDLVSTLLASGGIVAVVVGLASQEAASGMVSGMMILSSKPFEIGDTIILQDQGIRGKVIDIKLMHTILENVEKNLIMVPNTIMSKAIIENITQTQENKIAYFNVSVSYECDLNKAIEILKEVISSHPLYLKNEEIVVHCMDYEDSGIRLRAKVTTRNAADSFALLSDCRIKVKEEFDKNQIDIPYPHVQVVQK